MSCIIIIDWFQKQIANLYTCSVSLAGIVSLLDMTHDILRVIPEEFQKLGPNFSTGDMRNQYMQFSKVNYAHWCMINTNAFNYLKWLRLV